MDGIGDWLIGLIGNENNPIGLSLLAASAAIEYVFPPFPGDTVTLFGAFLITAKGWSFLWVFVSVLAGSVVGSAADYYLGRWLHHTAWWKKSEGNTRRAKIDRLIHRFQKHGAMYIALNRFLPGIRGLFFVAAGMAEIPISRVLFWAAVSAAAWNLAIIAVGATLGGSWDEIRDFGATYAMWTWIVIAAVVITLLVIAALRKRRERRTAPVQVP